MNPIKSAIVSIVGVLAIVLAPVLALGLSNSAQASSTQYCELTAASKEGNQITVVVCNQSFSFNVNDAANGSLSLGNVTLPDGPTATVTVTEQVEGPEVVIPGPTVTVPGATVTVPVVGPTIKIPGPTIKVPGPTIKVPQAPVTKTVKSIFTVRVTETPRPVVLTVTKAPKPAPTVTKTVTRQGPTETATIEALPEVDTEVLTRDMPANNKVKYIAAGGLALTIASLIGLLGTLIGYRIGWSDGERAEQAINRRWLARLLGK